MARKRIYAMHYGPTWLGATPTDYYRDWVYNDKSGRQSTLAWTVYRQDADGRPSVKQYPVVYDWHARLRDRMRATWRWERDPDPEKDIWRFEMWRGRKQAWEG